MGSMPFLLAPALLSMEPDPLPLVRGFLGIDTGDRPFTLTSLPSDSSIGMGTFRRIEGAYPLSGGIGYTIRRCLFFPLSATGFWRPGWHRRRHRHDCTLLFLLLSIEQGDVRLFPCRRNFFLARKIIPEGAPLNDGVSGGTTPFFSPFLFMERHPGRG